MVKSTSLVGLETNFIEERQDAISNGLISVAPQVTKGDEHDLFNGWLDGIHREHLHTSSKRTILKETELLEKVHEGSP